MNKFNIVALGCKVNSYEAQSISDSLVKLGYQVSLKDEIADVYIVFTCAVTNVAESKTRKKISQVKRKNRNAVICVVGCYVQINQELFEEDQDIDIIIGSKHKDQIPNIIHNYFSDRNRVVLVDDVHETVGFESLPIAKFSNQIRAYLKIQDGCNQFCSYCIIPYARGRERSIDLVDAIEQANVLVNNGHQEIVLAGIHTGRYRDVKGHNLMVLIEELLKIEGLKRLRLSSIEISEISDELIALIVNNDKMAKHLHIPLQSGHDATLRRMNRPYDTAFFVNRVAYIRKQCPDISISTDLIVGFAGENEDEFNTTIKLIKTLELTFLHVFPFAKKTNTAASVMTNHVSDIIKKQRMAICTDLSVKLYYNYKNRFINRTVQVLVEKNDGKTSFGHSSEYIPVYVNTSLALNTIVDCKILEINDQGLIGEVIKCY